MWSIKVPSRISSKKLKSLKMQFDHKYAQAITENTTVGTSEHDAKLNNFIAKLHEVLVD
jgi:hypothetical protein